MDQTTIYDVIVIGGGPAGSTTATTLAKAGHQVLLLEKAKFPREHVGESLLPFCYQIFEDLGVLDQIEANFTRKPGVTFTNEDGSSFSSWCFSQVIDDASYLSFHVVRAKFDHILLKNSSNNGVTVLEEARVITADLDSKAEEVSVKVARGGQELIFNARFLVDASGQDTLLAKQLKYKNPITSLNPRVAYATHWVDINADEELSHGNLKIVHLDGEKLGWIWLTPIGENRMSIGLALNMDYANAERRRLSKLSKDWQLDFYLQELQSSPLTAKVIAGAKMVQPLASAGDFSYSSSTKYGKNFAMVGDASAFLDPLFASGIYLGMKGGQYVANGVSAILKQQDYSVLEEAYVNIEGAYALIEEMIKTFYSPNSIRFSEANRILEEGFEKSESAFSIIHLLLAGDFFTQHKKYIKAVDLLRDQSMVEKYCNLIKHPLVKQMSTVCKKREALEENLV